MINTYVLRKKLNPSRVNPESNIECPLDELGLIEISDNSNPKDRTFRKSTPKLNSIDPHIFMAILVDMNSKKTRSEFLTYWPPKMLEESLI